MIIGCHETCQVSPLYTHTHMCVWMNKMISRAPVSAASLRVQEMFSFPLVCVGLLATSCLAQHTGQREDSFFVAFFFKSHVTR